MDMFVSAVAGASQDAPEAFNFRLLGNRGLAPTWKGRAADNVAAIKLALEIERRGTPATEDEQADLMRFVGFGATDLATSLFPLPGQEFRKGWEDIGGQLTAAVTPAEMAALARATQYAHYTPEWLVRGIWRGLRRMGFTGGAVLEPGCGTGLFLALMPEGIASRSSFLGVEADPTTARIARLVHPESDILHADFTLAKLPDGFDLAIGNPPFSSRTVRGIGQAGTLGLSLHDYFIARSVAHLRDGGLAAFVVSRYTMDKQDPAGREYIASMADLLAAVRLPAGAMRADAGTDVMVDVLFFRKRLAGETKRDHWLGTTRLFEGMYGQDMVVGTGNQYFADHPEMVLGKAAAVSSPYGPTYTVLPGATPIDMALATALEALPAGIYQPAPRIPSPAPSEPAYVPSYTVPDVDVGTAAEGATIKEGSYFLAASYDQRLVHDLYAQADYASGAERKRLLARVSAEKSRAALLFQVIDGRPEPVPVRSAQNPTGIFGKHARIIGGLVAIRDAVRAVLRAQEANKPWEGAQAQLREAYDAFVKQYGPINLTTVLHSTNPETGEDREIHRRPNLQPFLDDPDCWLVASIESYDLESGTGKPGPIFTERVVREPAAPVINSAVDAMAVVLNATGAVDIDRIAELRSVSAADALVELGGAVFFDPQSKVWQTADAYLSGQVRSKLELAKQAAEEDPDRFTRNVEALVAVQPVDLEPSDITARLGAPWIPTDVIERFVEEVIGIETRVIHTAEIASWTVDGWHFMGMASSTSEWGTQRRPANLLLEDALNAHIPQIYDTIRNADGSKSQVLNAPETEAAKDKLAKLKQAFQDWVWRDADRVTRLVRIYNDGYNNLVGRTFDGAHLTLDAVSATFNPRTHQRRAVWRIICDGSTYLAHAVGAGKTGEIIIAMMEQKRLGLITKPMIVVPGHCLAQFSREFMQIYPTARILVADEQNFAKEKRARFIARAATASWDAIIITHSAFKFIATPADFERQMVDAALASFEEMLASVSENDRVSRKRLERLKEGMEAKLEALKSRKDDMLTIAEIGVDQIVVDEAQEFRKLTFATNMSTLKGVDPDGSQRAWDLFVKAKFIETINPGRALILSSGTPITNTMGEMFTLLRFMADEMLRERHVHEFDAWANSFCDTKTELELQPSGAYKPVTRFSEFVNVPELISMFRAKADVVLASELGGLVKLPSLRTGKRQVVSVPASLTFRSYQRHLAERIKLIEERKGPPKKGDDIILTVIGDGRHAAIDMRFVGVQTSYYGNRETFHRYEDNEPGNKLNALITNVHRIWKETSDNVYHQIATGEPYTLRGAAQMIFSDLGTLNAEVTRGFSAYRWIKTRLVQMGVPAEQIAFMQDYKKSEQKQRLFASIDAGKVRVLIGSSETMGTGVNAQRRLVALHHLDVPWLPSHIEQREGRILRQGNENEVIDLFAYATAGSMDATMWQANERKARFIAAALAGDKSIRRLEDIGTSQADQFAMAKAIASGDPRLMQQAGLVSEVARLRRLAAAHFNDQHAVNHHVTTARQDIEVCDRRIPQIEHDLTVRTETRGEAFTMEVTGNTYTERKIAGDLLISKLRIMEKEKSTEDLIIGKLGGFELRAAGTKTISGMYFLEFLIERTGFSEEIRFKSVGDGLGLLHSLEYRIAHFEDDLVNFRVRLSGARHRLSEYEPRLGEKFGLQAELDAKEDELDALNDQLAKNEARPDDHVSGETALTVGTADDDAPDLSELADAVVSGYRSAA